jgi:hypothetical protein
MVGGRRSFLYGGRPANYRKPDFYSGSHKWLLLHRATGGYDFCVIEFTIVGNPGDTDWKHKSDSTGNND